MTHLRLRLELASRRTRRAIEERRRAIRSSAQLFAANNRAAKQAAQSDYLRVRWQAELVRERAAFEEFFDRYDDLVGLVCLAAQDGVEAWQEDKFRERRAWFVSHYGRFGRYLTPHLPGIPRERGMTPWSQTKAGADLFETLFQPATLANLLAADNGGLIGALTQAQEVLTAWERDLKRREKAAA